MLTWSLSIIALLAGMGLGVTVTVNTQLGKNLSSAIAAGAASFLIGTVALLFVSIVFVQSWPSPGMILDTEWVIWIGGALGGGYLAGTILLIPRLGVATTIGLQIAGQMLVSLFIDHFGLLWVRTDSIDLADFLGALLAIAGVWLIIYAFSNGAESGAGSEIPPTYKAALLICALAIGAIPPTQGALNARLREVLDAPLLSGLASFVIGTMALILLVAAYRGAHPCFKGATNAPWWAWTGGLFAAFYVCAVLILIPYIGTAVTIGMAVVGQQLVSAMVDHFGWLGQVQRTVTPSRLTGILALLSGVILIQIL